MSLKFMCTCTEKKPCSHQKRHEEYMKFLKANKITFRDGVAKGREEMKKEIEKVIDGWHDTSIKDPHSRLAIMVLNGGYINKLDLKKRIGRLK